MNRPLELSQRCKGFWYKQVYVHHNKSSNAAKLSSQQTTSRRKTQADDNKEDCHFAINPTIRSNYILPQYYDETYIIVLFYSQLKGWRVMTGCLTYHALEIIILRNCRSSNTWLLLNLSAKRWARIKLYGRRYSRPIRIHVSPLMADGSLTEVRSHRSNVLLRILLRGIDIIIFSFRCLHRRNADEDCSLHIFFVEPWNRQ